MVLLPVASAESWDWQSTVPVADAPTYVKKLDLDAGQLITASIHSVRPSAMPWRHTQSQVGCAQSPEDVGNIHEEDCSEVKTDIVSTRAIQPTELATRHWPGVWLDPSHSQGEAESTFFSASDDAHLSVAKATSYGRGGALPEHERLQSFYGRALTQENGWYNPSTATPLGEIRNREVDNSADLDDFEIDDDSHIPSTVTLLGQTRNRDVANLADLDDFEMDAGSALSPPLLTQTRQPATKAVPSRTIRKRMAMMTGLNLLLPACCLERV